MVYEIKKIGLELLFIILLLIMLPFVSAIMGVTAFYWDGNPLVMSPGETKDDAFFLQNTLKDDNVVLKVELIEGSEIATLIDPNLEYIVPGGGENIPVNVRISIPENTPIEKEYIIKATFTQVKAKAGGMIHLGTSITKSFPVIVKAPPKPTEEEKPTTITNTVLVIILMIIIIAYFVLKKKKGPSPFTR